jgi:phosphoglycolate phosphatase
MLVLAMERLGAAPHECVMVGDSRNDALAGRAAGTRVLLVGTGYNEGEPIGIWARENGFPAPLAGIAQVVEDLISEEDSA